MARVLSVSPKVAGGGADSQEKGLCCELLLKCFLEASPLVFLAWLYRPPMGSLPDNPLKKTRVEPLMRTWRWARHRSRWQELFVLTVREEGR